MQTDGAFLAMSYVVSCCSHSYHSRRCYNTTCTGIFRQSIDKDAQNLQYLLFFLRQSDNHYLCNVAWHIQAIKLYYEQYGRKRVEVRLLHRPVLHKVKVQRSDAPDIDQPSQSMSTCTCKQTSNSMDRTSCHTSIMPWMVTTSSSSF